MNALVPLQVVIAVEALWALVALERPVVLAQRLRNRRRVRVRRIHKRTA
jgi:hypothetical protein